MPLATSLAIFQSCKIIGVPKSTRCAILRDMAKVRKAERRPPLNKTHKLKRQDWAKKYLKTDFSKVLWTDEMRVSLDGPDGWARGWIGKGQGAPVRLRRQQDGGGVLVWAGIIKDELVGPFQVEDGVELNSQSYCQFLEDTFFKQWYRKKSASFQKNMIFMQDNAPTHASKYSTAWLARKGIKEEKLMTWPPCSPDLNPIENLWSIIKCEIYKEGKQYTSLNSVWEAVVANVGFKKLVETLDKRYDFPSRNHFSRVCLPALYDECRQGVLKDLANVKYFATTTDLWSSQTMEPNMSLTVHFIDADFNMETRCLQTSYFPEDHTGQNIAAGLRQAIAAWNLDEGKLICMTTDNARNVTLAAQLNGWMRLQCFGHRLHLAIGKLDMIYGCNY
ncbi:transposable element Tc3 transposase [Nothobranchius furzeri]|uniref:transposable element Tc3 transposase n=1 Tax=Nothobranchius furzeri TaxID=105023 RepID=UPI003904D126